MKIGKLNNDLLKKIIFQQIKFKSQDVIKRAGVGKDCAVVDFGENVCVLSTDPITGASNEVGKLAVHISCNDIASEGLEPLGIMLALMVPEGTTEYEIGQIMKQAAEEAEKLKVEIIGGHTEITDAVNKTVIVSTAIGKIAKTKYLNTDTINVGDAIILTKYAGLEGTGIIAHDHEEYLSKFMSPEAIKNAKDMLKDISVVKEGSIAGKIGVASMHDVTEGGVLGAVWEICESSKMGATIYYDKIPVTKETLKICDIYNLDYLKLISSGCMIITVSQKKKEKLLNAFIKEKILATEIGVIEKKDIKLIKQGKETDIKPPESDELYKVNK